MSSVIAFDRPGGEALAPARKSIPINLAHLDRQTMGDRALEQEILGLFAQQACALRSQIASAAPQDRARLAHGFKGAAMAIGAFPLAECASSIMDQPTDSQPLRQLSQLTDDVLAFIARFTR